MKERDATTWALRVFAFALVVRALTLWELADSLLLNTIVGDGLNYDAWARELAGGDWLGSEVYFQAPLYPHFIAVVYLFFGSHAFAVLCVQVVLGAASCGLLALTGWRWFSPQAGVATGLLFAIYAPAIFGDLDLQKTGLSSFLVCLVLYLFSRVDETPGPGLLIGLGVATGALTLARENALIFVVIFAAWLALRGGMPSRGSLVAAGLFVVGVGTALTPVVLRNWVVSEEFHLTTSQFGANFYIGNNEYADGTYAPVVPRRGDPRIERLDIIAVAEHGAGRKLTAAEVSAWYTEQALAWITSEPLDWLALCARKLALSLNAVEVVDTKDVYSHADLSVVMSLANAVFHFGVLAPLAALGVWITWPRRRDFVPLYLLFLAYTAALIPFYVFARYRLALIPILMLFAGAAIVGVRPFVREAARPVLGASLALCLAVAVFSNWPFHDRDYMRSVTQYNLGNELVAAEKFDDAMGRYRRAIELSPENAMANLNLGALLARKDDLYGARAHYERALEIAPRYGQVRSNLLLTYEELGQKHEARGEVDRAIENYEHAIELDPENERYHEALARLRARRS